MPRLRRHAHGFTLVEVLVALAIMAVLAALTWRGIDGMTRSQEVSQAALERTTRLGTVLQQWERDLQAVQQGAGVPALAFDGATLRLTRTADSGLQLVAWSLRDGALWRWASAPLTRSADIQEQWFRSQQLLGDEPGTLRVLGEVGQMQVYFYRNNAWTNAQSAGDQDDTDNPNPPSGNPVTPQPPAGGASGPAAAPVSASEALPAGVRLQLSFSTGQLTRDVLLSGQGY
ncbi:MAG: prepilin-type N-terminal cleavage/methylation domain-containing protein [Rubrivivax sp.]|jgi:general secretion pathway protein J|nr:prepilin-type N-terminal cleavage/methylation domain-containing protein [Rubrivivax sp.]